MNTVETNTRKKVTIQHFVDEYFLYNMGIRESVDGIACDPVAKFIKLMKDSGVARSIEFIRIRRKLKDKNAEGHTRIETLKELFNFLMESTKDLQTNTSNHREILTGITLKIL